MDYPLLIQVENTSPARPVAGISAANTVFQYLTEGGITRFSALFLRAPGVVGPVRSARFVSVYLYHRFDALLMCSGGSGYTYQKIFNDPANNSQEQVLPAIVNDFSHGYFFRWDGRVAPHNLYMAQDQMSKATARGARQPNHTDIARSDHWGGTAPVPSISVPAEHTSFTYSDGGYGIVTDGEQLNDVVFGPVRPKSVAVLHVPQWSTSMAENDSGGVARDYNLNAGGVAEFYSGGTMITGSWASPGDHVPMTFADSNGQPLAMPSGLLWVMLAP
jgi:hypothetical protein